MSRWPVHVKLLAFHVVDPAVHVGHHRCPEVLVASAFNAAQKVKLEVAWFEQVVAWQRAYLVWIHSPNKAWRDQNHQFLFRLLNPVHAREAVNDWDVCKERSARRVTRHAVLQQASHCQGLAFLHFNRRLEVTGADGSHR